ncbi:hypothetical protein Presley_54 [Acinetobacter phage Presley]|uniref:Uncharacterized protein n=1 Tax=Acinetobacter phage Presley TaxID=1406780 RepID=U5PWJ7_9CAUD|nr:hypothetical protein Presley_54 [Acinetobacter phage Presley]AGY48121.1 hypothetical protein Presley_54 [Acinetobacter phage Presley]
MSHFNDGQSDVEYVEIGEAINDKKGEFLPVAGRILNTNIRIIMDFLTGGTGSNKLIGHSLPVTRGGTGATSAQSARENIGLGFVDCNRVLRSAMPSMDVYDDKLVAGPYLVTKNKPVKQLIKLGTGTYKITNVEKFSGFIALLDPFNKPVFHVAIEEYNEETQELTFVTSDPEWGTYGWGRSTRLIDIYTGYYFTMLIE